jgi:hypothetical protein
MLPWQNRGCTLSGYAVTDQVDLTQSHKGTKKGSTHYKIYLSFAVLCVLHAFV